MVVFRRRKSVLLTPFSDAGCSKRRPSHPPNPGAPRRALSQARPQLRGYPSFHVSRLTFHGSWERSENAAWERARLGVPGSGG
jgi:hypothetical protein